MTKLGTCELMIAHNNKEKNCTFLVVPRNRQALLGMPDIEILNIVTIYCNAIATKETIEMPFATQTQPSLRVQEGRKMLCKCQQ